MFKWLTSKIKSFARNRNSKRRKRRKKTRESATKRLDRLELRLFEENIKRDRRRKQNYIQ